MNSVGRKLFTSSSTISPAVVLALCQGLALVYASVALLGEALTFDAFFAPSFQAAVGYAILLLCWISPALFYHLSTAHSMHLITDFKEFITLLALAFMDLESMVCIIYAYQYTNVVSIGVLSSVTLPLVLILSSVFLKIAFRCHQIIATLICIAGVVLYVYADSMFQNLDASGKYLAGDALVIGSACFQAAGSVLADWYLNGLKTSQGAEFDHFKTWSRMNATEAFLGIFLATIQAWVLGEIDGLVLSGWSSSWTFYLFGFGVLRAVFMSAMPMILLLCSASIFMISLQTANFYIFVGAMLFFGFVFKWLYLGAACVVVFAIVVFCFEDILVSEQSIAISSEKSTDEELKEIDIEAGLKDNTSISL
eukprot:TRINITY_DN9555_c0_g1_i1.p1 TRINITY_DN9555_c0_g1~~TRINITY_DN9555_c0_g1_i1.p1  ORF type:complete len:366 (-),score=102.33 TRINITY_DN9555_c0_g1_i1:140-1237(-)